MVQVGGSHVGMDQRGDGETTVGGAPQLFGIDHRGKRVEFAATVLRVETDAQQSEPTHLAQHGARNLARLLPCIAMRQYLFINKPANGLPQHLVLGREVGKFLVQGGGGNHE